MNEPQTFRSACNGFHREDVVNHIAYMTTTHETQTNQLRSENEALRSELEALRAQLDGNTAEQDRIPGLEQTIAEQAEQLSSLREELETANQLAEEILRDLHGEGAYESAVRISEQLFAGNIKEIPVNDLLAGLKDVPHFTTEGGAIMDVLVNAKICSSKREAREFLSTGSLSLNGEQIKATDIVIDASTAIGGKYIVIRRGKKKYYLGELA